MLHYKNNEDTTPQNNQINSESHLTSTTKKMPWVTPILQVLNISKTAGGDQSMAESNNGVFS